MNQDKVGEFIQQRRKALGLTQKELADKLGISDKTVSKWETGKGMPDISSIPELCKILNVSINELLLGEEISQEDLSKKTEENIMSLLNINHKQRKYVMIQLCLGIGLLIFSVVLLSFSGFQNKGMLKNYLDYPCNQKRQYQIHAMHFSNRKCLFFGFFRSYSKQVLCNIFQPETSRSPERCKFRE